MSSSKPLSFIFDVFGYYQPDLRDTRQILRNELLPPMSTYDVDALVVGSGYTNSSASTVGVVTNAVQPSNPTIVTAVALVNNVYFPGTILAAATKGAFTTVAGPISASDLIVFPLNTNKVNKLKSSPLLVPTSPAPTGSPLGITDAMTVLELSEGGSNVVVACYATQATGATNTQNLFCTNYMNINYPDKKWILFVYSPLTVTDSNIQTLRALYNVEVTVPGISIATSTGVACQYMIISKGIEVSAFPLPNTSTSTIAVASPYVIPYVVQCLNINVSTNKTSGFNSSNNYYSSSLQ